MLHFHLSCVLPRQLVLMVRGVVSPLCFTLKEKCQRLLSLLHFSQDRLTAVWPQPRAQAMGLLAWVLTAPGLQGDTEAN